MSFAQSAGGEGAYIVLDENALISVRRRASVRGFTRACAAIRSEHDHPFM
jgi:hypothetical protein